MYIAIDRDNLKILWKHSDVYLLNDLAHIEAPHVTVHIQPCDCTGFLSGYTDLELKLLYENTLCKSQSFYRADLKLLLLYYVTEMPTVKANKFELGLQANYIPEGNQHPYKYVSNSSTPIKRKGKDIFDLPFWFSTPVDNEKEIVAKGQNLIDTLYPENKIVKPLEPAKATCYSEVLSIGSLTNYPKGNEIMSEELTPEQLAAKEAAKEAAKAEKAAVAQAKKEEKAKAALAKKEAKEQAKKDAADKKAADVMPSQNDVTRPKNGTKCGQIWAILDSLSSTKGSPVAIAEALSASKEHGFAVDTVKTQYARWRKFHGVTGRVVVTPAPEAPAV